MKAFDKQEKELIQSVENGQWIPDTNSRIEIRKAKRAARNTFTKDQRMNIRIARRDMNLLKLKAVENGMPYQTLVSSIIHKYLKGVLVDK
jgi:predicted DNA binding CopG/RHH family protein